MRTLFVIGIGTGNPAHMTLEGIEALERTGIIFVPTKGEDKGQLAVVRRTIIGKHARPGTQIVEFALPVRDNANPSYRAGVDDWHAAIAQQYRAMIAEMDGHATGAFLVWGDPGLYDSTLRILERVRASGLSFQTRVLPGISAVAALTAAFAIPLNTIGNPITITTGRRLTEGWPQGADSVVVMLDGEKTYARVDPEDLHIYWAGYVGMEQEILIEGPLAAVRDEISAARDAARIEHGWIMDIYLLRRTKAYDRAGKLSNFS